MMTCWVGQEDQIGVDNIYFVSQFFGLLQKISNETFFRALRTSFDFVLLFRMSFWAFFYTASVSRRLLVSRISGDPHA